MANTLLTIDMITQESLRLLENQCVLVHRVNREYDREFGKDGAKVGDTVRVRKLPRFVVSDGVTLGTAQDITEEYTNISLNKRKHITFAASSQEMLLSLDRFSQRVLAPAVSQLAHRIDMDGMELYKSIPHAVGAIGTAPNGLATYLAAGVKLDNSAAPNDRGGRHVIVNPNMQATIVDGLKGLFQSSEQIKEQYEEGKMGRTAGFDWWMSQNVRTHTVGALGGTPLIAGSISTGATSITTDGWTNNAAILKQGDVIQIAGVFEVNPNTRESTGQLRDFVVTADVTANGSGAATIPISPAIINSGATQTVTALPADNAAIKVFDVAAASQSTIAAGTSPQALAFHREAFGFVMAPLPSAAEDLPGAMGSTATNKATGLSVRVVKQYAIGSDTTTWRVDVLYGWKVLREDLACRILS